MKNAKIPLLLLITTLLFFNFQGTANAQKASSLLTITDKQVVDYPESTEFLNKLSSRSDLAAMHFAEFGDWETSLNENDAFTISLFGKTATWIPTNIEEFDDRVYYGGHFEDQSGNLSIVDYGDKIVGSISVNGIYYQIFPVDNREVVLLETTETVQAKTCPNIESSNAHHTGCTDAFTFCPAVVRVLFLATPEAMNRIENQGYEFGTFVDLMTGYTNEALVNSALVNKRISSVFHPTPISQLTEPVTSSGFYTLNDAGTETALLREEYEADVVFVWANSMASASGYAMQVGSTENNAYAMGEVFWDFKNGYNLHHELGHVFGGHHQPGVNGSNGCNAAHEIFLDTDANGVTIDQGFTAIWSGAGSRDYYRKHFSNPNVTWQGLPTGIHGERNNALFIDNHFCDIADFYPNLDFAVDINVTPNGEDPNCPSSYTLTANVTTPGPGNPGQPGYTFEWYVSTKPFFSVDNPGQYYGNGGFITVQDPLSFFKPNRYVKLTVTGSDGFHLSRTKFLKFCVHSKPHDDDVGDARLTNEGDTDLIVRPNPAEANSSIFLEGSLAEQVASVEVINSQGSIIQYVDFNSGEREHPFPYKRFKIKDANGFLFLLLKDGQGELLKTEKIFIR